MGNQLWFPTRTAMCSKCDRIATYRLSLKMPYDVNNGDNAKLALKKYELPENLSNYWYMSGATHHAYKGCDHCLTRDQKRFFKHIPQGWKEGAK